VTVIESLPSRQTAIDPVTLRHEGRVARLTLDRAGRGNAITSEMLRALVEACEEIRAHDIDVVILSASGPTFSVGFDLDEIISGRAADGAHTGARAIGANSSGATGHLIGISDTWTTSRPPSNAASASRSAVAPARV